MSTWNSTDAATWRFGGRIFFAVLALAGPGLAAVALATGRIPLILAFVPIGEINRQDHAAWFWMFETLFLALGVAGLSGLYWMRKRNGDHQQDKMPESGS